jgi:signal transduction histidine kinase/ActR/RegA family two-component response regulator
LKLLTDDLQSSRDSKDAERYDTLRDVNLSCKAALDILNDLLCFDKLESGILELHKQETHIIPFVTECIAMFQSQARANDVKMNFVNTGCDLDEAATCRCSFVSTEVPGEDRENYSRVPPTSMPIVQSESILIDKFKMDQVVRNLISNALKFTPKGGSINIKISHIPNTETQNHERRRPPPVAKRSRSPASIFMSTNSNSSAEISAMNDDIESGLDFTFTDGTLLLEVSDTGAGISLENQKRLFTDIVQFNPEILQAGGGSGLGLWITKGIVDLHNGKISVHSEGEGMGCKFSVELPMLRKAGFEVRLDLNPTRRPSASSAERGLSLSESSHNYDDAYLFETLSKSWMANDADPIPAATMSTGLNFVLLVVDDSRLNRKMLCKILRGAGCLCDEAEDGLQAIEIVKQKMSHPIVSKRHYDAILMDYIMPQLDGPTATKRIRALHYTAPIFGVTGNALDSDVDYFIKCGADKIFAKPLNVAEFELHMKSITPGAELDHEDMHTYI